MKYRDRKTRVRKRGNFNKIDVNEPLILMMVQVFLLSLSVDVYQVKTEKMNNAKNSVGGERVSRNTVISPIYEAYL